MEIFVTGIGAVLSGIIVFCGSIWLLLTMVMGPRLAYFVTASVTLGFVLIMGLVWSFTQLGPVGQLPEYRDVALGEGGDVDFAAASAYPGEPWAAPAEDDDEAQTKASEAESGATDAIETALTEGEIDTFESIDQAQVVDDSTRLLVQEDAEYAAVLMGPLTTGDAPAEPETPDPSQEGTVLVILRYDPGNPLGMARIITVGIFAMLVVHLFGLSRAEARARRRTAELEGAV